MVDPTKKPPEKPPKETIYTALNLPFFITTVIGLFPFSLPTYYREKKLKTSWISNFWCIFIMVNLAAHYHFALSTNYSEEDNSASKSSNLTTAIGLFIIYMEPAMMIVDVLAALINQKTILSVFDRIQAVDEKLDKENIKVEYRKVIKLGRILIAIVLTTELLLTTLNFIVFTTNINFVAFYYFFTGIPLILNAIAKVWFIILIVIVRERFQAINKYLNDTSKIFSEQKKKYQPEEINFIPGKNNNFLEKEMFFTKNQKNVDKAFNPQKLKTIKVSPFVATKDPVPVLNTISGEIIKMTENIKFVDEKEFIVGDKMDDKLTVLCKLHDEICEIAKTLNQVFSFQMLIMMAYGFMSVTAQFYFLYCGLMDQPIPSQFRSAASVHISLLFIFYTACKCVAITFVCWKTKYDARKTGVYLHKLAHTVDELHFYNVVNHLSLKLLNHQLNFTACGFFDLDMTTIYAITGAITSYLIILIQFNLAAVRTKRVGVDTNVTTSFPMVMGNTTTLGQ